MSTFTPPPQLSDAQQITSIVALNYLLSQHQVNVKNISLRRSPVYYKALGEAVYILCYYIHLPANVVRKTFNLTQKRWSDYLSTVDFNCKQYEWYNEKIELYANGIMSLIINPQANESKPTDNAR